MNKQKQEQKQTYSEHILKSKVAPYLIEQSFAVNGTEVLVLPSEEVPVWSTGQVREMTCGLQEATTWVLRFHILCGSTFLNVFV